MKVDGVLPGNHILKGRSSLGLQGGSTKQSGQLQSLRGCSGRRTMGRLDGVLRATRLENQLARPWLNPPRPIDKVRSRRPVQRIRR